MRKRRIGWLLWLLFVACLYFFENNGGTRAVLISSVLLPSLSLGWAAYAARKARCTLTAPQQAQKGGQVEIACGIALPRRMVGCVAVAELEIRNPLTGEAAYRKITVSGSGPRGVALSAAHCGCLRVTARQIVLTDWLELGCFPVRGTAECTVPVLPPLYPVRLEPAPQAAQAEDAAARAFPALSGSPESDIRAYVPGDPVGQIHWKLSAKLDQLLVREPVRLRTVSRLLLLETTLPQPMPEQMDAAAEALLSVSRAMAEEGFPHSVCWADGSGRALQWMDIEGPQDAGALRDAVLRSASTLGGESIGRLLNSAEPDLHADRVYLFSPHPDTDALCLLDQNTVTLILPESAGTGSPGDIPVISFSPKEALIPV